MEGGAGDDRLYGYGGDDFLVGQDGNDFISGDGGNDTPNRLLVRLGWRVRRRNDTLLGGSGNDGLYAGDGDDKLTGGDGIDYLTGENGNDWLDAGSAWETVDGGAGYDFNAFVTAVNGATYSDITQGSGNTCWILAAIGSTAAVVKICHSGSATWGTGHAG